MDSEHVTPEQEHEAPAAEDITASEAVDTPVESEPQQGWDGQDWDPQRYQRTLERIREERNEAKEAAARYRTEQGFLELARELGYELDDETEEPFADAEDPELYPSAFDPEDDPLAAEVQRLSQWQQQQDESQYNNAVTGLADEVASHLNELAQGAGEPELSHQEALWIIETAAKQGFSLENPDADLIEKAFEDHCAWRNSIAEQKHKAYLETKKAAAPPSRGGTGGVVSEDIDPSDGKARKNLLARKLQERLG